jgi:hypothetical protein
MWFLEALVLVVLAGAVLGVVWRFVEDKLEKRDRRRREALDAELNDFQQSQATVNTVSAPTTKSN